MMQAGMMQPQQLHMMQSGMHTSPCTIIRMQTS
jgi:hypothetical protein